MNALKILLISIACAPIFAVAYADDRNCQNQISMQLQEEGWVSSKTAQVTVSIQVATSKNDVSSLVATITNKLKSLVKESISWRLVNLSTQKNSAGLFAVSAQMMARLDNDQLAQLQNRIDSLNKAGEQYKIESVDYQPTLAEIAAENTRLRTLIYKDVLEQQKIINASLPDTNYQLQSLHFESPYVANPKPMLMYASVNMAKQATATNTVPFSQQLIVSANVSFSSPNSSCETQNK